MKHLFYCLICLALLPLTACGGEDYDPETVEALITRYDAGEKLSYADYTVMIAQQRLALESIREKYREILADDDPAEARQQYAALASDTDFSHMAAQSERMRRILILSQKDYSEENRLQFEEVWHLGSAVDQLDDDIIRMTASKDGPER